MADGPSLDPRDPAYRSRISDDRTRARADLTDIGFATAGSVYNSKNDPNVAAAWGKAGSNISSVLQERWFRKEFEGFNDMYLMPYVESLRGMDGDLVEKFGMLDTTGQIMNPDGTMTKLDPNSPEAEDIKKKWLSASVQGLARSTDDLMNAALKYGNGNPLIDVRLNQIMQSHTEVIGQITNPQQFMQGQMDEAKLRSEQQQPGLLSAQTKDTLAHARYMDRMPQAADGGSGPRRDPKGQSPEAYKRDWGVVDTASLMASGQDPWSQPYLVKEENRARNDIIASARKAHVDGKKGVTEKTGIGPDGSIVNQETFDRLIAEQAGDIKLKGTIGAARALFPGDEGMETEMRRRYPEYYKTEEVAEVGTGPKVHIAKAQTRTQLKTSRSEVEDIGYKAIDKAFKDGTLTKESSNEEIASVAGEAIDAAVTADESNPEATQQATKLAQDAWEEVSANWTEYSQVGREVTGKLSIGDRLEGIIEDTGSKVKKGKRAAGRKVKEGLGL